MARLIPFQTADVIQIDVGPQSTALLLGNRQYTSKGGALRAKVWTEQVLKVPTSTFEALCQEGMRQLHALQQALQPRPTAPSPETQPGAPAAPPAPEAAADLAAAAPPIIKAPSSRRDPCPCNSGKMYKNCHEPKGTALASVPAPQEPAGESAQDSPPPA